MESRLIICTTAVTRPDLHTEVFPLYFRFLQDVDYTWIINIDPIEKTETVFNTQENLIKLYSQYVQDYNRQKLIFTVGVQGGTRESFYNSVQRLVFKAWELNQNENILWLEDDWKWDESYILNKKDLDLINNMDYLQLVRRHDGNAVSFNPGIWGKELFRKFCVERIKEPFSPENANPERRCTYPIEVVRPSVEKYMHRSCFTDIGREWTSRRSIWRTFQKKA